MRYFFFIIIVIYTNVVNAVLMIDIPFSASETVANETLLDVDLRKVTANVTIIKRDTFENKATTLDEIVFNQTGTTVRSAGGVGSYSQISIRGASSRQVVVYLDGVLLNSASGGGVDLSQIPIDSVASVEIYKNNAPIQFAQQFQGGVINIKSINVSSNDALNVKALMGSFGAKKLSSTKTVARKKWNILFNLNTEFADNNFIYLYDNGTKSNTFDDVLTGRNNAQINKAKGLIKGTYQVSANKKISSQLNFSKSKQHLPKIDNDINDQSFFKSAAINYQLAFSNSSFNDWSWINKFTLRNKQEQFQSLGLNANGLVFDYDNLAINLQHYREKSYDLNSYFLTIKNNIQYTKERFKSIAPDVLLVNSGSLNNVYNRDELNLTVEVPINNESKHFLLVPKIHLKALEDVNKEQQKDDKTLSEIDKTLSLGFQYQLSDNWKINANIGNYVRQPSFTEKYTNQGLIRGNANLVKETGINKDIGISYVLPKNKWIKQAVLVSNLFTNQVDDVIIQTFSAAGLGRFVNLASATVNGFEFEAKATMWERVRINANYSFQQSQVRSKDSALNGTQLPNQPVHAFNMFVEQRFNEWVLFYRGHYSTGEYYDHTNLLIVEDKKIHDVGLTYQYRKTNITAEVKNLLDVNHQTFNGYPTPGISYFLTLNSRF